MHVRVNSLVQNLFPLGRAFLIFMVSITWVIIGITGWAVGLGVPNPLDASTCNTSIRQ